MFCNPVNEKNLIIKLDSLSDAFRTTCLLPALKQKFPQSMITWFTDKSAAPLLANNKFLDDIWSSPDLYLSALNSEKFDIVINIGNE